MESKSRPVTRGARAELKRILIVDDDEEVCQTIAEYIEEFQHPQPYDVSVAHDGAEAYAHVLRARPDLLLVDLRMPRMGGVGLLRDLHTRGLRIPTIVITGSTDLEEIATVLRAQGMAYVPKPVNLEYLENLIGMALARWTPEPAARGSA